MKAETIQTQTKVIKAILELSGLERLTSNSMKIHGAIYKLKQEFPEDFERLYFNTNCSFPTSSDLEDIFSCYITSGRMSWDGCSNHYNFLKNKGYTSKLKGEVSKEEFKHLKKMANKFKRYITN
jgi:hypothetical protein